ncbi:hypothetical protein PGTUg99_000715 [Puccinia graminis f. sp. tritici]|uniref:Uncharacterized protein n=1 Tax=Puccinia graminis f. sp. tritici TaxID=56615 RepID=A0A5B0RIT9_PUCGR|nr:hypothetical protein PGTUg99_000715 [Puccinia graminis f. sp. tritici]
MCRRWATSTVACDELVMADTRPLISSDSERRFRSEVAKHLDRVAPHERSDNGLPRAGITLGGPMLKIPPATLAIFATDERASILFKNVPRDAQGKVDLEGYDA